MGNPVIHFEIGGADAERSCRFYSELFGWGVEIDDSGYGIVQTGSDAGIGGGILQAPQGRRPWVSFYVGVEDLDTHLSRVEELGGSRVMGPVAMGDAGAFAMFADPDGNVVGLFTQH